jgi:hypothetical protein
VSSRFREEQEVRPADVMNAKDRVYVAQQFTEAMRNSDAQHTIFSAPPRLCVLCSFFARSFKDYATCFAARSRAGAADLRAASWASWFKIRARSKEIVRLHRRSRRFVKHPSAQPAKSAVR